MKQYISILIETRANLRIIKFNNPKRKNAFDMHSYTEIPDALQDADNDDSVAMVALTGVGDFYSSGNDIKSAVESLFSSGDDSEKIVGESNNKLKRFVSTFYSFKKPLVAVVNGPCIGIAATTAALCDVLYASETAYFYTPFTLLGLCPEGCSSYTFPKIFGPSKASEMLMFHYKLSAQEAYQYKFVSELFSAQTETKIWQKLENFSKLPRGSLKAAKMLTKKFELNRLEEANLEEIIELNKRWKSEEAMNAAMEFVNRRKSKL